MYNVKVAQRALGNLEKRLKVELSNIEKTLPEHLQMSFSREEVYVKICEANLPKVIKILKTLGLTFEDFVAGCLVYDVRHRRNWPHTSRHHVHQFDRLKRYKGKPIPTPWNKVLAFCIQCGIS